MVRGCNDINVIEFKRNTHYPTLRSILQSVRLSCRQSVTVTFTLDSKYVLGNHDQYDWNKLYGKGNVWRFGSKRKEEFWAWRYLPFYDRFEVVKYQREGGNFYWGEEVKVKPNKPIELDNSWFSLPIPLPAYFGGTSKTPHEIIIECQ